MTITATCGHQIQQADEPIGIIRKGYTGEGKRCLSSEVVCMRCYRIYRADGELLDNEAEEQAWVRYEEE